MSYEFDDAGVYYYSDYCREEAAEYIGTIIVKPRQEEHFVELTAQGFTPGNSHPLYGYMFMWYHEINVHKVEYGKPVNIYMVKKVNQQFESLQIDGYMFRKI